MSEWISTAERMPDDELMVIGYTPCDGYMFIGYHITSKFGDYDYSHWNIVTSMRSTKKMTKKVSHWMPLPSSPSKESKESAEDVEIIHCSDCRDFDDTGYDNPDPEMPELRMGYCRSWRRDTQACVFCSHGIRK